MEFFLFWIVFTVLVGVFANAKKRSVLGWCFISLIFSPLVAFLFLLVLPTVKPEEPNLELVVAEERICPYCAEPIKRAAIKCKHCGSDVAPEEASVSQVDEVVDESMRQLMRQHNISKEKDGYRWGNSTYKTLADLKNAMDGHN